MGHIQCYSMHQTFLESAVCTFHQLAKHLVFYVYCTTCNAFLFFAILIYYLIFITFSQLWGSVRTRREPVTECSHIMSSQRDDEQWRAASLCCRSYGYCCLTVCVAWWTIGRMQSCTVFAVWQMAKSFHQICSMVDLDGWLTNILAGHSR